MTSYNVIIVVITGQLLLQVSVKILCKVQSKLPQECWKSQGLTTKISGSWIRNRYHYIMYHAGVINFLLSLGCPLHLTEGEWTSHSLFRSHVRPQQLQARTKRWQIHATIQGRSGGRW